MKDGFASEALWRASVALVWKEGAGTGSIQLTSTVISCFSLVLPSIADPVPNSACQIQVITNPTLSCRARDAIVGGSDSFCPPAISRGQTSSSNLREWLRSIWNISSRGPDHQHFLIMAGKSISLGSRIKVRHARACLSRE